MLPWLKYFTRGRIGRNLLLFWKGEGETNYLRVEIDWGLDAFSKASRCLIKLSRQFTIACRSANRTLNCLRDISASKAYIPDTVPKPIISSRVPLADPLSP